MKILSIPFETCKTGLTRTSNILSYFYSIKYGDLFLIILKVITHFKLTRK